MENVSERRNAVTPEYSFCPQKEHIQRISKKKDFINVGRCVPTNHKELYKGALEVERRELKAALCKAIVEYISDFRAVFLPKFGIVYPEETQRSRVEPKQGMQRVVRTEVARGINFEKCDELSSVNFSAHGEIVDSRELSLRVQSLLTGESRGVWPQARVRALIEALAAVIKQETVLRGYSYQLRGFLSFFSLHNRQGLDPADWFAGADIFVTSDFTKIVAYEDRFEFEQPIFEDAFEPFEAALGCPVRRLTFDPEKDFSDLAECREQHLMWHSRQPVEIACFKIPYPPNNGGHNQALFISNGFRHSGIKKSGKGTEIILKLEVKHDLEEYDAWIKSAFALAWVLIQSRASKNLKVGSAIAGESNEKGWAPGSFVCTKSTYFPTLQYSLEGAFDYLNFVGITADEARLLSSGGRDHLLALLSRKGLDEITRINRASLLHKTECSLQP